jgi:two-component system, LuxR family, sensor kinase FixL
LNGLPVENNTDLYQNAADGTRQALHPEIAESGAIRHNRTMAREGTVPQLPTDEIIDIVGALLVVLDTEGRIVSFNSACERATGYRRDEVIGKAIWSFLIPTEQHGAVQEVFRFLADGSGTNAFTNDWIAKNGERRTISWTNTVSRRPDGSVEYVIGTGADMTDFLATEAALRNNRSLLQMIIATSPEAIVTIDDTGVVESFNATAEDIFGYAAHEVVGQKVNMLMPEPYASEHDGYLDRYLKTHERRIIGIGREVQAKRKDGSTFPVELAVGEVEFGERRLFTGFIRDISRRRNAELAQAESDRRLAEALEGLPLGVILCDADGKVTHVNREMRKFMGPIGQSLRPGDNYENVVRKTLESDVVILDGQEKEQWQRERLAQIRSPDRTETELHYANGDWVLAIEQKTPNGELMALRIDIGRLKRAEEALHASRERQRVLEAEFHHVSRLSAMGEMAATLAHELNQPLTAVINYVQACRRLMQSGAGEKVPELLGKAVDQAHRAGEIISHIRGFVTRGDSERAHGNLNAVVREACELALVGVKAGGIDVTMELAEGLPPVLMDAVQIQQVVVNLVRNSVDALLACQDCEDRRIEIVTGRDDPGHVAVSVKDNGPGLDPKVAARLFESFNTNKTGGMGIGLSVCRSIVREHEGAIDATSNPDGGVTFRFTLPVEA